MIGSEANGREKAPNATSLYEEAQALTFSGADTTGNVLMVGMFNMLEKPELMERLKKELLEIWPVLKSAPPKLEELERLPFLVSCLTSNLRYII